MYGGLTAKKNFADGHGYRPAAIGFEFLERKHGARSLGEFCFGQGTPALSSAVP